MEKFSEGQEDKRGKLSETRKICESSVEETSERNIKGRCVFIQKGGRAEGETWRYAEAAVTGSQSLHRSHSTVFLTTWQPHSLLQHTQADVPTLPLMNIQTRPEL